MADPPSRVNQDDVSGSLTVQAGLGEGLGQEAVRLPASDEPGLERFWPIPLYAVAFFIHRRYRVWRPRVLPTITSLKLPEIYGSFALGHAADIEADRLCERIVRERDANRYSIHLFAATIGDFFHDSSSKGDKDYQYLFADITHPDLWHHLSGSDDRSELRAELEHLHWKSRCIWSNKRSRELASLMLFSSIHKLDLSEHDARILVMYVAERTYTGSYFRPQFVIDHLTRPHILPTALPSHRQFFQGAIPRFFAQFTALALWHRWMGFSKWLLWTFTGPQRVLFHLWVYRTLWGRYCHWESLWSLEDPAKAGAVIAAAGDDLVRWFEPKSESDSDGRDKE
ncbi:hypothetical protein K466DRAFT_599667 [Polyporus arcularius HHB13444]|uniref:Uncharacterized protein n=1 Tax=Polyporus arcularius HHB13444 TaxID=1314778 RepID=A0A5C3PG77_9APHY|nr:hypothetical protein K466DRAFT_599667 [Polyporus arcularius HHB13444]